jgi:hypothetical protein
MKFVRTGVLILVILLLSLAVIAAAQDRAAGPNSNDPRVGLKAGYKDAGVAAKNIELVKNIAKPDGFILPAAP